jgi:hypothetical protein
MKNTKNKFKALDSAGTSQVYKTIKSVAYHLANKVSDAPTEIEERKKRYYEVENLLKRAFVSYDRALKLATPLQDLATLEKYKTVKRFPKALTVAPKVAKTSTKKRATSKRI